MTTPKVTTGAIIIRDGKVLLGKRGHEPYAGKWGLIGGHVDRGETAKHGITREVKEETGLAFKPVFWRHYDEIIPSINWHAVVLFYTGEATGEPCADGDETLALRWFSQDDIEGMDLAFEHKKAISDYFAQHA